MKKLLTLMFIAVLTTVTADVFSQASGPILIKTEWTYDSGAEKARLELGFDSLTTSFPVFIEIIIQDDLTGVPLDTLSAAAMQPTKIFFVDLPPNRFFMAMYKFENGDGQSQYSQQFNTLVSSVNEVTSSSPRVYVAGNQIMITNTTADKKVAMYDILGRTLFEGLSSGEGFSIQKPTGVGAHCFIVIGKEEEKKLVIRVFISP